MTFETKRKEKCIFKHMQIINENNKTKCINFYGTALTTKQILVRTHLSLIQNSLTVHWITYQKTK